MSDAILPPKPDELAVAFASALLSTGRYDDPSAAIGAAWAAVPHFYLFRRTYAEQIAPLFFIAASQDTQAGSVTPAKAP